MTASDAQRRQLRRAMRLLAVLPSTLILTLLAVLAWELHHADAAERFIHALIEGALLLGLLLAWATVRQMRNVSRDYDQALREQVQAVAARDQFLSIASHELKTPLTSLQLQLQSLKRGPDEGGVADERLAHRLEAVARSAGRLSELVNQLLDVSRITAGAFELEREELDLAALCREVAGRFEAPLRASRSTLSVHAPHSVYGRWDRMRLDTIVTNLLANAIKYGEGRPIELGVDLGAGGKARLWVKDHGIGIAPADQARIFDRFERAVPQRHYGGFGVGLWVVRLAAEAHGGRIQVASTPGEGSTFTLTLPCDAES